MARTRLWIALLAAFFFLGTSAPHAQWVAAAHAVKNRIQQMTQKSGNGGYDVAIVLLEAAPHQVYDRTLKSLQAHPELTITKARQQNRENRVSQGRPGRRFPDFTLGEKLTQLIIASSISQNSDSSATALVVSAVLRVCKEVDSQMHFEPN